MEGRALTQQLCVRVLRRSRRRLVVTGVSDAHLMVELASWSSAPKGWSEATEPRFSAVIVDGHPPRRETLGAFDRSAVATWGQKMKVRMGQEAARGGRALGSSVLVVDDDAAVCTTLQRVLQSAGFEVTVAHDGAAAMTEVERRPFDVILTDIQMGAISGVELLSKVRAHDLDVPVILMTGEPTLETAIEAISLGVMHYLVKPTPNAEVLKIVERASQLHRMARMKRDALQLQGEANSQAGDRAGLQVNFDRALQSMWMAFQPIVAPEQKRVFGYEALMRTKEASLPHPGAVLEAAERLNRLPDLGRRVRQLSAEAFRDVPSETALLFINLHTRDLLDAMLFDASAPLTKMASRVVLEITERAAIDDVKDLQVRVDMLRQRGFRIAIDDLGAGYAGLSSFVALQPEIVKLDMSLIRNVHQSDVRRRLVGSMTSLCNEMGMSVVAEGIEVIEERDAVGLSGCDLCQGYLFAKPGQGFPRVDGFS
jgi:EAL domain-containing protein (putative c-di-GMP-specific phosphodiesterase class I)